MFYYDSPILQIVLSLNLNLAYTLFIIGYKVTEDRSVRLREILNEIYIIGTIIFLSLFLGEFIADGERRENYGLILIGFTSFAFSANILTALFYFLRSKTRFCHKLYLLK